MSSGRCWIVCLLALIGALQIVQGAVPSSRRAKKEACREGWVENGDFCYKVVQGARVPHALAFERCKEESGQARLATLNDGAREFLAKQIRNGGGNSVWLAGASDECPSVDGDGQVTTKNCLESRDFMCEEFSTFFGCPEGSYGFGDYCFTEAQIRNTWRLARIFCRTVGVRGELASVNSPETYDFLKRTFGGEGKDRMWIGLHKEAADIPYRWTTGERVNYLPWGSQYLGQESTGYVAMDLSEDEDGQFIHLPDASDVLPFVCASQRVIDAAFDIRDTIKDAVEDVENEIEDAWDAIKEADEDLREELREATNEVWNKIKDAKDDVRDEIKDATGDVTELLTDCERGWLPFGRYCYRAFFERKSFSGASHACREEGGELPGFHNPIENDFVRTQVLKERRNEPYWIGLSRGREGLRWSDDSPLDWLNWSVDKLNETVDKAKDVFDSCFSMDYFLPKWTPRTCEVLLFYVCEKPNEKQEEEEKTLMTQRKSPTLKSTQGLKAAPSLASSNQIQKASSGSGGKSGNTAAIFGIVGAAVGLVAAAVGIIRYRRSSGRSQYTMTAPLCARRSGRRENLDMDDVKQTLRGSQAKETVVSPRVYGSTA